MSQTGPVAIDLPPPVLAGDPVSAAHTNAILAAVRALDERDRRARAAIEAALARPGDLGRLLPAIIIAAPPPGVPLYPSACPYTAQVMHLGDAARFSGLPAFRADVRGDECKIWPAVIGDPCFVLRWRDTRPYGGPGGGEIGEWRADLWVISEKIYRRPCAQAPGG